MKPLLPPIAGALALFSGAALADTSVSAVTDLNVRAGPGPQYPVTGVLKAGQPATLTGCLENSKWCTIAEAGGQGWVYSDYVTAEFAAPALSSPRGRLMPALQSSRRRLTLANIRPPIRPPLFQANLSR
jgi:uncharacterized protein YraI